MWLQNLSIWEPSVQPISTVSWLVFGGGTLPCLCVCVCVCVSECPSGRSGTLTEHRLDYARPFLCCVGCHGIFETAEGRLPPPTTITTLPTCHLPSSQPLVWNSVLVGRPRLLAGQGSAGSLPSNAGSQIFKTSSASPSGTKLAKFLSSGLECPFSLKF